MSDIYFEDFRDREGVEEAFECKISPNLNIIFAAYTTEDYCSQAIVLLKDMVNGHLYEVNGGHCSCNGLEDQWELEETSKESIEHRIKSASDYTILHMFKDQINAALLKA